MIEFIGFMKTVNQVFFGLNISFSGSLEMSIQDLKYLNTKKTPAIHILKNPMMTTIIQRNIKK